MCANTTDIIQTIAAVSGVIVAIFGFAFVYEQIKQVNSSIKSNTHSAISTRTFECSQLLFQNIDLYKYFYNNAELDTNNSNYEKAFLFSEIIMDHFQFIFLEKDNMDKEIYSKWKIYMKSLYNTSPILRSYLSISKSSYSNEMIVFLEN